MSSETRVLITAFEPFGGQAVNASQLAMGGMSPDRLPGVALMRAELPVVFGASLSALQGHLDRYEPHLVVCLGEAGGRHGISIERVAINIDDARIADNEGAKPIDEPIAIDGPAAYWSTLPIKALAHGLREAGFPAEVSQSAGTFVCNHVFYGLMHSLSTRQGCKGGFVHVPYAPTQVQGLGGKLPFMASGDAARALELLVRLSLSTKEDLRLTGGATH